MKRILFIMLLLMSNVAFASDFTATFLGDYGNVTVMEVTGNYDANPDDSTTYVPRTVITKEFFRTHKDEYDFLVIFSNFDFRMPNEDAKAFYLHVKNDIRGIGQQPFDYSPLFVSNGRLQGIIDMGNIATFSIDPLDPRFEVTLSTLAHEQMHRWGAFAKFRDPSGSTSGALLGSGDHWSFLLNSYGSVLYGNYWQDNGNGTFTSIAAEKYYSPLDLYLMGLYDKSQVPPMLLIDNSAIDPARMPETGATITGTPRYITIEDIIAAEGERVPGSADSQKTFKTAFILITAPGTFTGNELYGIENVRNGWVTRFSVLTDGKGLMQVVSTLQDNVPTNPGIIPPTVTPRPLPPNINDGVKWLMVNQKGNGSWMDLAQTTDRDTSESVYVLKNFDVAQQNFSAGLQWLGADISENTDYLARKIETLLSSGQDVTLLIGELISRQNSDGGWGSNKEYVSNTADTALVMKSLSAYGYSEQGVISNAMEYLGSVQNSDGGWGGDDGGSIVESTAKVLSAFGKYRQTYSLEDRLAKGIAWLTQRQNSDGGFGNSPSTVYDTALAVVTLQELDASKDILNNGLNYVLNNQSADGSWVESPYQTALAINAVWKATVSPNLSIKTDDITFIPASVKGIPSNVVINAVLRNCGRTDVAQAKVALYEGSVSDANKIGEQIVAFPGEASVTVTFSVTIKDGNEHRFYIVADPENLVKESNESNNAALKILYPQATYDFEVLSTDISATPNPVDMFQDVKITSKISNKGTINAYNVQIKYYIDDAGSPFDIATATVDIPAGVTMTNEIIWHANKAGVNLPVTVLVDPFNTFAEMSEENNKAVTYITVNGSTLPNLTVSYKDMVITPNPANQEGNSNISVLVKNEGFSAASNIKVSFYKGTPGVDGVLIGTQTIPSLGAGESSRISIDWMNIMESGENIIYIKVDPDNMIKEVREDDNDAFTTLRILSLPDFAVSSNSITFNPPAPKDGDTVSIQVIVQNKGEQSVSNVPVRASHGSAPIGTQIIASIPGNSQASTSFNYDTSGKKGAHQITVVIDPDNTITEQSKNNNIASSTFGVQDANLWLTEQYISPNGDGVKDSTQLFFRLDIPRSVKVLVVNGKGKTVRTFSGVELDNVSSDNIVWDGLSDNGMVVADGQYQIKLVDVSNNTLGSLLVVVDNNRSPITDAIGTKYLSRSTITIDLPKMSDGKWQWFHDESGILVDLFYYVGETPDPKYPAGLYYVSSAGNDIFRLFSQDWSGRNYRLSPDGRIAFVLLKTNTQTQKVSEQLWVIDKDSLELKLLLDSASDNNYSIGDMEWSPNGEYIFYTKQSNNGFEQKILKSDGTSNIKIDSVFIWPGSGRWSPDGTKLAYVVDKSIRVYDIASGTKKDVYLSTLAYPFVDADLEWLGNQKLVVAENVSYDNNNLWLIDVVRDDNNVKLAENFISSSVVNLISPDKRYLAFVTYQNTISYVKMADSEGNVSVLKECYNTIYQRCTSNDNIAWAHNSRKVAFIIGDLRYYGDRRIATVDVKTKEVVISDRRTSADTLVGWLNDDLSLFGYQIWVNGLPAGAYVINSETGEEVILDIPTDFYWCGGFIYCGNFSEFPRKEQTVSPFGNYVSYITMNTNGAGGDRDLWTISSLLNLVANLAVTKEKSSVILKGTAQDLNFEGYKLEYADANNPNAWNLIAPPSNVPVVNDVFTTWVPPYEGRFHVQLTVWDKAGNVATKRKMVSWGQSSIITGLYKNYEIFSPNGDAIKDTVELHYTVHEPVHLEFNIYDENDTVITTIKKDYTAPVDDYITWDGRDSSGKLVPDGKYKIKVFDFEFFVEVDNTPPDISLGLSKIMQDSLNQADYAELFGHAVDKNLKKWIIEYGEGDNPQQWNEYRKGEDLLVGKDDVGNPVLNPAEDIMIAQYKDASFENIEWLVQKKFRITAEDFSGNKSSQITNFLEERIIFEKLENTMVFLSECDALVVEAPATFGARETIREELSSVIAQYEDDGIWEGGVALQAVSGTIYMTATMSGLKLKNCQIRLKAVTISGNEYYSNSQTLFLSGYSQTELQDICQSAAQLSLDIIYSDADCGQTPKKTVVSAALRSSGNVLLRTLNYYIQKPEGLELLRQVDLSWEVWNTVTIDTLSTPEGSYPVKAVVNYIDLLDNKVKEISATNTLVVDRALPTAKITYPGKSLMICPAMVTDAKGNWPGIAVEGAATDNTNVKRYEIFYGLGDSPATWLPASTRINGKAVPIVVNGPKQGQLGIWDITGINLHDLSVKLRVVDASGNVSCDTISFSVDGIADIANLATDKSRFSPNGDGYFDNVNVNFTINEYAKVDMKVFKLIQNEDGSYTLDSTPVRTIIAGLQHLGGTETTSWDGKDDSNAVVPDGLYGIAVFATDSCNNTNLKWIDVEVDNSPPTTIITYPRPPDSIGTIVEVRGTTDDQNFKSYTLEAGQGDNPDTWNTISSRIAPVKDNVLGTWNTSGLEGKWTLRLMATDTAGNKGSTTVTLNLGVKSNLISGFTVTPKLFSPNNDGKLDSTTITYSLTAACQIILDLLDSAGVARKTYSTSVASTGPYALTWDGRDNAGATIPDGTYKIKLHAALSSNPSVTQDETITVAADSSPPLVDIKQPAGNSYLKGGLTVSGTITDANPLEYSITYTSPSGSVILDKGSQNRSNYTFGVVNDLPEGAYVLNVKAKDLAENATETNISFTIDRTSPQVALDNPKEGEFYGTDKNLMSINGTITESNLETYSLRYGAEGSPTQWTELQAGTTVPSNPQLFVWKVGKNDGIPDGLYTVSFYAKDKAGLTGEARVKITIDNTSPEVSITSPQDGSYVKGSVDIKGTAFDANLDKYTLELSEGQCASAFKWGVIKIGTASIREGVIAPWPVLSSDGNYCLRLTAIDKLENKTETKVNVKVDTHPPSAPVLSGKIENKTDASLSWTQNAEPDVAGYDIYRNGQKINATLLKGNTHLDQSLTEGVYAYTVKAIDLAGNEGPLSNEVKLRVDVTGPAAKISLPRDGSRVGGLIDIKGTAYSDDDFKQYRVSLAQGSNPTAWNLIRTSPMPIPYGTLAQWDTLGLKGIYSIRLEAEDLTGNINSQQITITVDDIPPAAPVVMSAVDSGSNVSIMWSPNTETDLAGYLLFRNNRLANTPSNSTAEWKLYLITCTAYIDKSLPDGKFTYYVVAVDQAGNMSDQSNSMDVVIDTHAPRATIVQPADKTEFDSALLIKGETPDLDVASIQFQYRKAADTTWENLGSAVITQPYTANLDPVGVGLNYGDYSLRAVATDKGGNTDLSPPSITVTYADLTAPSDPFNLKAVINGRDVTLSWAANTENDLSGYSVYRSAGGAKVKINTSIITDTTYQDKGLADGQYTYEVTASDTSGNEGKPSNSVSAKVYAPLIGQPYTPTGQKTIQIQGSNAEQNSNVEIYIDSGAGYGLRVTAPASPAGGFSANLNLDLGENRIIAKAIDGTGNVSRSSDMITVVYNEPPAAPTGLTATVQGHDVSLTWNPNTEEDLSGYNLYREGLKLNTPIAVISGNVTATSSAYPPSYAFDSNQSTYWISVYNSGTFNLQWWQIDLPSPELVNHMEVQWFNESYAGKDFEIQVWSGCTWITQAKVTGNTSKDNAFEFSPSYRTDKIRIYITDTTGSSKQVGIAEIKILKDNLLTQTSYQDASLHDGTYTYKVTAVDYYGFESLPSDEAKTDVGDVTPPSAPQNLTVIASESKVVLNWSPNTDPDLAGYNVYRNTSVGWVKINTSLIAVSTYMDVNLSNGVYTYRVTAVDSTGNESQPSNEVTASVSISLLPAPANLTVSSLPEGGSLRLSWQKPDGDVGGYNLYRAAKTGGPYSKVNTALITSTSYVDTGLTNGLAYYYVVTAVDVIGNESGHSNEAMGIPSDEAAPPKPYIFFPAVPGASVILYNDKTDISGGAEPGATVELVENGGSAGNSVALDKDAFQSFSLDVGTSDASLSPDGKTLAYSYGGSIWLRTLSSGNTDKIITEGYGPLWSSDGTKIIYIFTDSNGKNLISIYDVKTGDAALITDGAAWYENNPSWSSDGEKVALSRYVNSSWNAWIKDLVSGSLTQVTNGRYIFYSKLAPDGRKLAYFEYQNLYLLDFTNGDVTLIDDRAVPPFLDWSPDSKQVAFASNKNGNSGILVVDASTKNRTSSAGSPLTKNSPVWSPDGKKLALMWQESDGSWSIWIKSLEGQGGDRVLQQKLGGPVYLSWVRSGGIAYIDQNTLTIAYSAGYFSFRDAQLYPGENSFYATASDPLGNASEPSDTISVILASSLMPDLEITSDNINIYPPSPIAGQTASLTAFIENKGETELKDIGADVYLWDSHGNVTLIKTGSILTIAPHSEEPITAVLDTTGKIGTNKIMVIVDPEDKIQERSETNNTATKEFFVAQSEGVVMTTTLDSGQYKGNRNVNITVDLKNSGIEREGIVETKVEDQSGQIVTVLDTRTIQLPYAADQNYALLWNTGSTYEGSYNVHAVFKDASANIISENIVPFTILPDMVVDSTVVTNKIDYVSHEDVLITINTRNSGQNYIIPALNVNIKIMDASNNKLFTDNKSVANLLPGSTVNASSIWNTGLTPPGSYNIVVETYAADNLIASRSVAIRINAAINIAGSVTISPAVVAAGSTAQVSYAVQNTGNANITGLPVSILLLDPESQAIIATHSDTVDLAMNTAKNGTVTFSAQGCALKTYIVALQVSYQGNKKTLATASFTVKDITPPVVTIVSPVQGNSYNAKVDIAATATDDASGIDRVEYRIDSRGWSSMPVADPATGRYATTWSPTSADGGKHTMGFRATDKAGNTSAVVSVTITINLAPPTGTILINNGAAYTNTPEVTLNLSASDSDGSSPAKMCISNTDSCAVWEDYAETKAWTLLPGDGTKTVYVWYQDKFGNADTVPFSDSITLDTTVPVLVISTLSDGSWTNSQILNVAGTATDDTGIQQLAINGTVVTPNPDGSFSWPVVLNGGSNSITVKAVDLAGNHASETRTVNFDQDSPVITITSPADNIKTKQSPIDITGSVDDQSTVTVSLNGAAPVATVMNGTSFSLTVTPIYGLNTIEVTATDIAGNTATAKRTITFDDQNPSLSVTDPPQDITTNQSTVIIKGEVSDLTIVTMTMTTDGNTYTPVLTGGTFQQPVSFSTEKTYQVYVTAVDEAGNEITVQRNIVYDITPPSITVDPVTSPTDLTSQVLSGTMEAGATLSVTCATATVGAVTYPTAATWTATLSNMQEGTNTLAVTASDAAGNVSASITVNIVVDTVPSLTTITGKPSDPSNNNSAIFSFASTKEGSTFQCRIDGESFVGCTSPMKYAGLTEGTHTFSVKATDASGNTEPAPASFTWTVDTKPPVSTIASPLSGSTIMASTITIKGIASDTGTQIREVEVSTDGGATWGSATSTISWSYEWTPPADGTYTLKSRATDSAGNVEIPGAGTTIHVYKRQPTNTSTRGRQLLVNGNPFIIKGVVYSPVPIGDDPETTPPYGDYFTSGYHSIHSRDLPLLRQMGANTVRLLTWDGNADQHDFLDSAYNGGVNPVYVVAGYWINPGLNIDPQSPDNVREQLKDDFRQMVAAHKNHPAILMWTIGNDLNDSSMYGGNLTNLFSLINEMAEGAHAEEGSSYHPVTTALTDSYLISTISTYDAAVPSLDLWGANIYRGNSFGTLFNDFKAASSKPLVILEYGIDAFDDVHGDEYENIGTPYQATHAEALWSEIKANADVCTGGSIMEYCDEWWKGKYSTGPGCPDNDAAFHSVCGFSMSLSTDEYDNEEWWGIMRRRRNASGPDIMERRVLYYTLQKLWAESAGTAHISVSPSTANFGSVAVGDTAPTQVFTVSNAGTESLVIGSIGVLGANGTEFTKQNDSCSGHTLIPSNACTLQVVFSPVTAGSKNATLSILSDDPVTPTVSVPLSGIATASISGTVTSGHGPMKGVTMTLSGSAQANIATDEAGIYIFSGLLNGSYTVTPGKTGYVFAPLSRSVNISGSDVTGQNFAGTMAALTITASAGVNGTISPSGIVTVNYGANQTFNITPSKDCHIVNVIVDGVSQGPISSYTFTNVTVNHVISASFIVNTGVFGAAGVSMSGGYVDSYDSSKGAYTGVHGSNGPVGTNSTARGAINLSGGAIIYGDVSVGPGGDPTKAITTSGGAVIYGTRGTLSAAREMIPATDPGGGTPTSFTNGTTLTSGTYRVSSINLSSGGTGTINGNVTLYVTDKITLSGTAKIVMLPGSSLTIYIGGSMNVSGGGIVNQTLNPHALIIYGTSTCTTANYSGSSALYGSIYALKASVAISGGSVIYGSVVGNSVTISGGAVVHCEESL